MTCSVSNVTYLGQKSFKFELLEVVVDPLVEALRAHQRHLLSDSGGDLVLVCLLHQFRHEELHLKSNIVQRHSWYGGGMELPLTLLTFYENQTIIDFKSKKLSHAIHARMHMHACHTF